MSIPISRLNDKTNTIPVIVSLTTIESRLKKVHITLRSVMNQSKKPEKIILWINDNDKIILRIILIIINTFTIFLLKKISFFLIPV